MGKIPERFRLVLPRHRGDDVSRTIDDQVRTLDRWANELPYPELTTWTLAADTAVANVTTVLGTFNFKTYHKQTPITVHIWFDFNHSVAGGVLARGRLLVDGAAQTGDPRAQLDDTCTRATVSQGYDFIVPTPGTHTVEVQAIKTAAGGTCSARANHTRAQLLTY